MEEGVFENGLTGFGSLVGDALGGIRDVLVAREEARSTVDAARVRAEFGLPHVAQSDPTARATAAPGSFGGNTTMLIVIGLVGLAAVFALTR